MVRLDTQLLFRARRLFNGGNAHLNEMILAYEQAVDLYNRHSQGHEVYRIQSEARLRQSVFESEGEDIFRRTTCA